MSDVEPNFVLTHIPSVKSVMEFVFHDRCGIKEDEVLDTSEMDEKSRFAIFH